MSNPLVLVLIFIISALVGYKVIKNIPSLLHTPLMSGMNALSGITAIGAIIVIISIMKWRSIASMFTSDSFNAEFYFLISIGGLALILAMINVVGGFGVTDRMLRMFNKKKKGGDK